MRSGHRGIKPAALRRLHGSEDRAKHRRVVQAPAVTTLDPPPAFSVLETEFWAYYAPKLLELRILAAVDRELLANFCRTSAQVQEICVAQQRKGYKRIIGKRSSPLDACLRYWLQLQRLAGAELGLSPASRGRVQPIGPKEEADTLEDFITAPIHAVK
jgi:P27 family predicted phage terminase small subunit